MGVEYENLIKPTETQDLGTAIQNLINDNIKSLNTAFLARVTKINNNKICFNRLIKKKENEAEVVVNNCLIGFAFSQKWQVQYKLAVGDIGICFVMDCDVGDYKTGGNGGVAPTKRQKDLNDSVFVPLSLFNTLTNDSINFYIQSDTGNCKLHFDNSESGLFQSKLPLKIQNESQECFLIFGDDKMATLKAKLVTIQSENTTLKAELKKLASLLESMASGSTGLSGGNSHSHITSPSSKGKFSAWASALDSLFKA